MKIGWVTRLFIYGCIAMFVGPFYDNWTSMEKWIYRADAYADLCTAEERRAPATDTWRCSDQQERVSLLLSISRVAECFFSVVIGIFMDLAGPKLTAVIGVLVRIVGWSMMGFAARNHIALEIAFFLTGVSVNFIVFPALTIGLYTARFRYFTIVQIGMCSCFASLIIKFKLTILEAGWLTAGQINYLYTILCLVPSAVVSAIFFPYKLDGDEVISPRIDPCGALTPHVYTGLISRKHSTVSICPTPGRQRSFVAESARSLDRSARVTARPAERKERHPSAEEPSEPVPEPKPDGDGPLERSLSSQIRIELPRRLSSVCGEEWTLQGLVRTLSAKEVVVCLFYLAFNLGSITFVQQTFGIMYREEASLLTLNEYLIPLAFVFCLIFSFVYLYVQPIWIVILMNAMGAIMHIIGTYKSYYCGMLLSFSLVVTYSILNTKVYNYLDSIFEKTYMGSIIGALNTMCGIWLVAQAYILKGKTEPEQLTTIHYVMLGLRLFFLLPFGYFAVIDTRPPIS